MTNQSSETDSAQHFAEDKGYVMGKRDDLWEPDGRKNQTKHKQSRYYELLQEESIRRE